MTSQPLDRRPLIITDKPVPHGAHGHRALQPRAALTLAALAGVEIGRDGDAYADLTGAYDVAALMPARHGGWSPTFARQHADRVDLIDRVVILLGRLVADAFQIGHLHRYDWQLGDDAEPARALVVLPSAQHLTDPACRDATGRALHHATHLARPAPAPLAEPLTCDEHQTLAELAVLSTVAASRGSLAPATGSDVDRSPRGEHATPAERHAQRILTAPTRGARNAAHQAAHDELRYHRHAPPCLDTRPEPEWERDDRLIKLARWIPAHQVGATSDFLGLSERVVRKIRERNGLNPDTGIERDTGLTLEQTVAKHGLRPAARMLGIPTTTFMRKLGRAA